MKVSPYLVKLAKKVLSDENFDFSKATVGRKVKIYSYHDKPMGESVIKRITGKMVVLENGKRYSKTGIEILPVEQRSMASWLDETHIKFADNVTASDKGNIMNKTKVAEALLKIAKSLIAIEFPSQEAMDKYLKEHPDADKSNHTVKKEESTDLSRKTDKSKPKGNKVHEHAQKQLETHGIHGVQKAVNKQFDQAKDSAGMAHILHGRDHPITKKKNNTMRKLFKVKEKVDNHVDNYKKKLNELHSAKHNNNWDSNHPDVKKVQDQLETMKKKIS